mgnify:CR=1 FL=1|jgi:ribosomal protein S14|tara:strand:- start:1237 stop:1404 length:168 start_codon:yes stop_codon:yes gene_type:complete
MIKDKKKILKKNFYEKNDNKCEECGNESQSVRQNLIMHGYKFCESCKISKTLFPI